MKTGEKIRYFRKLKNFTQEQMADELNLSQRAYSKIENDETQLRLDRLEHIAKLLEVESTQLLPGSEQQVFQQVSYSQIGNGRVINNNVNEKERELYEKLLIKQQEEISYLKSVIAEIKKSPVS